MTYYHMTSLDRLDSISKKGLIPMNGDNSKLINDMKNKVFFSEQFDGCIALFVDFNIVYNNIKNLKEKLDDKNLETRILNSKDLRDYLKEGVYLAFDGSGIKNERNFENGCTSQIILPSMLNVCVLKNNTNNTIIYSRFEIIKYMMSRTNPEDIKYYGTNYEGSPNIFLATQRILKKVKKYYEENQEKINYYNNKNFIMEYIPINEFINEHMKH